MKATRAVSRKVDLILQLSCLDCARMRLLEKLGVQGIDYLMTAIRASQDDKLVEESESCAHTVESRQDMKIQHW